MGSRYYFRVLASSQHYHGKELLTYSYDKLLPVGSLVTIPLKKADILGIVVSKESQPNFKTKPINQVLSLPPLPASSLQLLDWIRNYYPAPLGAITAQFLPSGLDRHNHNKDTNTGSVTKKLKLPDLTKEQRLALQKINSTSNQRTFLLHGDTGSGKTRIYMELAARSLANDRSVLILTPEIGLTPQLVRDFEQYLGTTTIVLHSNLTPAQKRQAWLSVLEEKDPVVVIGPRSALFAPFKKLGLVVIDEAHDSAYKQEQAPYYRALRVAGQLANIHSSILVIGSATPDITDYYIAEARRIPLLRMQALAINAKAVKPQVSLVDKRNKELFSKNSYLSNLLIKEIGSSLERNEQVLIFLNRRGTARQIVCTNCGWQALCPNCDLLLTYHGDSHSMLCHTCGYKTQALSQCPVCKSPDIIYKTIGTKSVVDTLSGLFPKAKIDRFDADNKKADRFEQHYHRVLTGEVDILVGTQLLVKGLDLPKLSLVGVINADSSLSFPDYTAEENTYQLLSQIIGRIGRGHIPGKAIIQTYQPDSEVITAAINKDWPKFYNNQIQEREQFLFPPFCYLLKLACTRKTQKSSQETAVKLIKHLQKLALKIQIIGPSPSFYEKSKKGYTWQIVVKSKLRNNLLEVIKALPSGWSYNIDPTNLL